MVRYDPAVLARNAEQRARGHIVVIVTGTRFGTLPVWGTIVWWALYETVSDYRTWTLCHGGARGIDAIAHDVSQKVNNGPNRIRVYDAEWDRYGERAGPIRNRRMIDEAITASAEHDFPVVLLAFHDDPQPGSGTYDCLTYARQREIETIHYRADGTFDWRRPDGTILTPRHQVSPRHMQTSLLG